MTQDASWSSKSEHRAWLASHSGRSVPNSDEERQADLVARIFRSTCAMYPSNLQWATDTAEVILVYHSDVRYRRIWRSENGCVASSCLLTSK